MAKHTLKFGDIVAADNSTPAQQKQFDEVSALMEKIGHDPKVLRALAEIRVTEDRYKAKHPGPIFPGHNPEPPYVQKSADKLFSTIAHSFKSHGIDDAPATLNDYLAPRPSQEILRAAEASIILAAMRPEEATHPSRPFDTPVEPISKLYALTHGH
jgi:hypothetical protein